MPPNLYPLVIMGAAVRADTPLQPLESFPSVRRLSLDGLSIDRRPDPASSTFTYWDIIRSFPNIHFLYMADLFAFCLMSEDTPPTSTSFPELSLDFLWVHVRDSGIILQQLLDMGCLRSVDNLNVESGWFNSTPALNHVIEQHGGQLRDLSIVLSTDISPNLPLQFDTCTQLMRLEFFIAATTRPQPEVVNSHPWDLITDAIISIPSSSPNPWDLAIYLKAFGDFAGVLEDLRTSVNWERLDSALDAHQSLRAILIVFSDFSGVHPEVSGEPYRGLSDLLETSLPLARNKGTLSTAIAPRWSSEFAFHTYIE